MTQNNNKILICKYSHLGTKYLNECISFKIVLNSSTNVEMIFTELFLLKYKMLTVHSLLTYKEIEQNVCMCAVA